MYLQEQIERQEKFKEIFRTELASSFNAYEVLRLKQFKKYKFFQIMKKALVTITIISVIAHIACVIYSSNKQCPDEVMIFFFIGWAALAISNIPQFMAKKIKKDFSNLIKANCSDKILKAFGYLKQSDYIFSYEEISNTGLFNNIYSTKRQDDTL